MRDPQRRRAAARSQPECTGARRAGATVPTHERKMRCRFCGLGFYKAVTNFEATGDSIAATFAVQRIAQFVERAATFLTQEDVHI